ncbi:MAG TPA: type II toxin-antitoxin system VapC family toxin [Terriglobales bacterium]|nr:type II toxin-antitoxin system VapC family toxin [Terriglobales bacterium]
MRPVPARAVRIQRVAVDSASAAILQFERDWDYLTRVAVTEALVARAGQLAWKHGLRGYDAIQLAAALQYRDDMGDEVTMGTFDGNLGVAALHDGLAVWPPVTSLG